MAKQATARAANPLFTDPTTAAIAECTDPQFSDAFNNPNTGMISMAMDVKFNGASANYGYRIAFPFNASLAVKQAAVRNQINLFLADSEPGVSLNNSAIQIFGLPV